MVNRRTINVSVIGAVVLSMGLAAQKKDEKKQTDDQKREIQNVVKIVDDVAAGQPAPNDFAITWVHEDYMKAQGNKQYTPFTVTIDPKGASGTVAFYWRVVSKDAPPAPPPVADSKDAKKDDKDKKAQRAEYTCTRMSISSP